MTSSHLNYRRQISIHALREEGDPRRILDMVERMVERGSAEYLVIGGRLVGRRPFRVTGSSEAWDKVYSRGELAKATLTISLEEYA